MSSSDKYILVVEDSQDIREQMSHFYRSEGYAVKTAGDGRKALEILRESEALPAVILLDFMMPGMDGAQFRHEQEKDPRIATVPVLVMTADAHADIKAIRIGAKGYLRKPLAIETLLKVAEKFCH